MNNRKGFTSSASRGFTLLELLIVIVIIGVLATLATISLMKSRTQACDTKRLTDIRALQSALEMYYYDAGGYPQYLPGGGQPLFNSATNKTFMLRVPQPPSFCVYGDACKEPKDKNYEYLSSDRNKYRLNYCLDTSVNNLPAGPKFAKQGVLTEIASSTTPGVLGCKVDEDCVGSGTCQDAICKCGSGLGCTPSSQNCLPNPTDKNIWGCFNYSYTPGM